MERYQIAIYMRLSKEDEGEKYESNSITMQRKLLQGFVEKNFSDYDLLEFCDDGYTGTNFNRPDMQRMLEQVRAGGINCIIVKDFSRFARDYIELGSYLEQIFPFMGVRFISVNDNYDSKNYQGNIADIDVNFKNLLYDLYSKDISQKVRSSLAIRKEQGQYISAHCPFGYKKDKKDRHALLIAEDEAEVVRCIFSLTLEGYTSGKVARLFNETKVKTPIEFKIEKGTTMRTPKSGQFLWSSSTICQILRNEIYIGNIVQKKYIKDFVGGKNHIKPREEWVITYNHHEPIVDKEVFEKVQERRGKKRNPTIHSTHPFIGKVICGCCNKNLRYRRMRNSYFDCCNRYTNVMEKCVDKVNAMFLEEYVLFCMQRRLQAEGELKKFQREEIVKLEKEIKKHKDKCKILADEIQKLKEQNFNTYQNYVLGKIKKFQSCDEEVKLIENELAALHDTIQEKEAAYIKMKSTIQDISVKEDGIEETFAVLSKEMIDRYIEKIVVYNEQNIEISWKENRKQV